MIQNPRKSLKSCSESEANQDRISDLPGDIIDRILSSLPIKDAAKTSVLSTKWRYKWETISTLVFNNQSLPIVVDGNGIAMTDKLVVDIYCVLLLHSGPIRKFELSYDQNIPSSEMIKWIRYLSRHPPNEFVFKISNSEGYKMPSCVFSWQNLMVLGLTNCLLRPPSAFKGFKLLNVLNLQIVTVAQDVLECLISSSPVLQRLALGFVKGLDQLKIDAPILQSFYLRGNFVDISLKCMNLADFYINSVSDNNNGRLRNHDKLGKLMAEIPQIGKLTIRNSSLKYLADGFIPIELPLSCSNLYYLRIDVNFTRLNETSALLCLLRIVPNLQELHITAPNLQALHIASYKKIGETRASVWEADQWNRPFTRLRCVKLNNLSGLKVEMDLIKFLLLTAPVLKRMVIKLPKEVNDNKKVLEIVMQVCSFKRASPLAEIKF